MSYQIGLHFHLVMVPILLGGLRSLERSLIQSPKSWLLTTQCYKPCICSSPFRGVGDPTQLDVVYDNYQNCGVLKWNHCRLPSATHGEVTWSSIKHLGLSGANRQKPLAASYWLPVADRRRNWGLLIISVR